jgi:hypothetical protein
LDAFINERMVMPGAMGDNIAALTAYTRDSIKPTTTNRLS